MEIVAIVISLASLIVSIRAIRVSKDIAKMQLEYEEKAEKRREEKEELAEEKRDSEKRQELKNRKDAKQMANASSLARLAGKTKELEESIFLDKQLGKR
ncbi:hypothetical protein [uncultured Fibrobacter sp.]|uniref:hypothetical protein n=1 Tax=uncultured Fibrobacter sp. TaxID=261512 RepID=UPI00262FBFB7|nr:hypothetical protein [uncultured Fibrobacter sp.]